MAFLIDTGFKTDFLTILLLTIVLFTFIINSFLNIYALRKYFPDGVLNRKIKRYQNISTFFFTLDVLGLLILFTVSISELLSTRMSRTEIMFASIFFYFVFSSPVIWFNQLHIDNYLKKENNKKIGMLISSIGGQKIS